RLELHHPGRRLLLVVLVVRRNPLEIEDVEARARRQQRLGRPEREAVEGCLAEATGNAEDLDGGHAASPDRSERGEDTLAGRLGVEALVGVRGLVEPEVVGEDAA